MDTTYQILSPHSPAEIRARVAAKARPWSRADLWTARNTCFYRDRARRGFQLFKTGAGRGYVRADVALSSGADGGTVLAVSAGVPKTVYAADIGVCLWFLAYVCLTLYLRENPVRLLLCAWVPGVFLWMTRLAGRQIPELKQFLEEAVN